jgi:hypothetical protein
VEDPDVAVDPDMVDMADQDMADLDMADPDMQEDTLEDTPVDTLQVHQSLWDPQFNQQCTLSTVEDTQVVAAIQSAVEDTQAVAAIQSAVEDTQAVAEDTQAAMEDTQAVAATEDTLEDIPAAHVDKLKIWNKNLKLETNFRVFRLLNYSTSSCLGHIVIWTINSPSVYWLCRLYLTKTEVVLNKLVFIFKLCLRRMFLNCGYEVFFHSKKKLLAHNK